MSTWTYDLTTNVGKIRLIIGDTDIDPTSDAVFTDEELTYFLTVNSNNITLAAADALEAWRNDCKIKVCQEVLPINISFSLRTYILNSGILK